MYYFVINSHYMCVSILVFIFLLLFHLIFCVQFGLHFSLLLLLFINFISDYFISLNFDTRFGFYPFFLIDFFKKISLLNFSYFSC
jgi:hypothetical protein